MALSLAILEHLGLEVLRRVMGFREWVRTGNKAKASQGKIDGYNGLIIESQYLPFKTTT